MRTLEANPIWIRNEIKWPFNPINALYDYVDDLPWDDGFTEEEYVAKSYIHHSGSFKASSDTIFSLMEDSDDSQEFFGKSLAMYIWIMYRDKWKRLWDLYELEYNPIANTDISEISERGTDAKENRERNIDRSKIESETESSNDISSSVDKSDRYDKRKTNTTENGENTTNVEQTDAVDNNIYGFNSSTPSDSDDTHSFTTNKENSIDKTSRDSQEENSEISENKSNNTYQGNKSNRKNEFTNEGQKDKKINSIEEKINKKLVGYKNILPQEGINAELEFRRKLYMDMVFDDIDDILCLTVL